ncbi:glutathione gamma-glutamylcysteinyltransferase [Lichtheimia corymbifera JMRC:FSU:9682]|uniref:glutathione gamma-glutamylcysteinyltransferase n=1 Tax=Lichtheimia corymbifera JMRC:FSU:9682 TaxID=1263082 RepID=A0A068SGY5_9FUNG|nr:glutathione gamma-glutamylcysteinyltransferase [Lichtheimia corymbifera JMRC:FSU:9682]
MFRIALNTNRTRISTTTTPFLVKRRHAINPWSVHMSTAAVSSKTNDTTPTTTTTTTPSKETVAAQTSAFQDLLGLTSPSPDLKNTFYQRQLPETLVRFSSNQGKQLFRSAMEAGHAEGFFPLTGNFTTQSEPAYCGPSSLAMVLNALEVDPKQRWKGNWRWYSDELLDCCSSKEEMKKNGITFDKFACLAKCHSDVVVKRGNDFTLEEFVRDVQDVTMRSDKFMVISFSRKTLGQTGDGHFSPIGAYHPESGMVLVLDTARYKYPSYWCPVDVLYESMKPIDKETGRPRGYFLLSYDAERPPVSLCKVKNATANQHNEENDKKRQEQQQQQQPQQQQAVEEKTVSSAPALNWTTLAKSFCKRIPENMWLEKPRTMQHVVQLVLRNVPPEYTMILANQSLLAASATMPNDARSYIDTLLHDTTQSALYPIVLDALYPSSQRPTATNTVDQYAAFATLFMLGSPRMLYTSLPRDLQESLDTYRQDKSMSDVVKREVDRIGVEVSELTKTFCTCGPGWSSTIGATTGNNGNVSILDKDCS